MSLDTGLCDLLRDVRTRAKIHTHVLVGSPFGMYAIGSKMAEFWDKYLLSYDLQKPIYLAENPGKESPILVDVDLRTKKSNLVKDLEPGEHLYTQDQVYQVIAAYQNTLKKIVIDIKPEALTCVLLEKNHYYQEISGEKYVKNGFHLHFPKLFLDRKVQEVYLIPIVKKTLNGIFNHLEVHDFIDSNSVNVHWLMYGSSKPDNDPYQATSCFLDNCEEVALEEGLCDYILPKSRGEVEAPTCEGNVVDLLPRILSIALYGRESVYYYKPKPSVNTPLTENYELVKSKRKEYDQLSVDQALAFAQKLLGIMSPTRADDRSDWLAIGFCLWNITEGDEDGLSLWLEFSEQSEKFNEVECIYIWNTMRENKYTIGTLKFFAKADNPEDYAALVKSQGSLLLKEAVNGCHNDIARVLYNEYGNEFVCTSFGNKTWFQFKGHIWKESDKGIFLRERISCPNGVVIKQISDNIRTMVADLGDPNKDTKEVQGKIKKLGDVIRQCKSAPYKNNVMIECQEVFYNPEFYDLLNKDPYLVAFKNGVYDFNNDLFREGKPEDYLSTSLSIDYIDYGSIDHPKIVEIDDFFRKVFPDIEVRDYFLDQVCQVFVGGNHDKVILFWTGEGNNGKTVTQTLFEKMLGKLAIKFSTTLITGKKTQTGVANPELARAGDGVRWAVMEEPNPDETLSAGALKGLTGNDSYWARDLFEKGKSTKEICPMFKLHMICNKLPTLRDSDQATWNRIRVIPFEATFVPENECPESFDEQTAEKKFPMDKHFGDKIPELIQPLAWYLIQRWRTFNRLERIEPAKVKMATECYMRENDMLKQFENQCVFDRSEAKLTVSTLYNHVKEWFKEECPGHAVPTRSAIRQHFCSKWGDLVSNKHWLGKSCKQESMEIIINPMLE